MIELNRKTLAKAETLAGSGAGVTAVLAELRKLPLDDFGLLMISMPNEAFPNLSAVLPPMASAEVQKSWTGSSGVDLLRQTASFARQLESLSCRNLNRGLYGAKILDFGCGYGRIIRLMYYFSDPANIWGVDAWDRSLNLCKEANLPGNFVLSDAVPERLPVTETFDFAFSFSVFTHLSPKAATACLSAVRKSMKLGGVFVATTRPVEFWAYLDKQRKTSVAKEKEAEHAQKGYGYLPHQGAQGETYGDTSFDLDFFNQSGWTYLAHDRTLIDPYQVAVVLRAS